MYGEILIEIIIQVSWRRLIIVYDGGYFVGMYIGSDQPDESIHTKHLGWVFFCLSRNWPDPLWTRVYWFGLANPLPDPMLLDVGALQLYLSSRSCPCLLQLYSRPCPLHPTVSLLCLSSALLLQLHSTTTHRHFNFHFHSLTLLVTVSPALLSLTVIHVDTITQTPSNCFNK